MVPKFLLVLAKDAPVANHGFYWYTVIPVVPIVFCSMSFSRGDLKIYGEVNEIFHFGPKQMSMYFTGGCKTQKS